MKGLKKFLSVLLALTFIITSMPQLTFAENNSELGSQKIVLSEDLEVGDTLEQEVSEDAIVTESVYEPIPDSTEVNQPVTFNGDYFNATFTVLEKSADFFTGEIILENTSLINFESWELEFDLNQEIINIENANIKKHEYNKYVIIGDNQSSYLSIGDSKSIVFTAKLDGSIKIPSFYKLNGEVDFENYPQDEREYSIWKEQILERQLEKQNDITSYSVRSLTEAEPTSGTISNEYIKFNYLNGNYGVFTTGGNPDTPSDNNKNLLFGTGSTSYTTVRIDGKDYRFSPDTVTRYDNKIIGTKRYDDIVVSQHISIISNQYTKRILK